MNRQEIIEAYVFLREHNHSISDATLDFMKDVALKELNRIESSYRTASVFNVAPANEQAHEELVERLQQIRDRQVSDDMLILEAADILTDAQAPLLDIIEKMSVEFEVWRNE